MDAHWLCIQCPADYNNIVGRNKKTIMLEVGDINFDGKIDNEDYTLLAQYTATGAGATDLPYNKANWTPTDKQLLVMNCRTDTEWHRQEINVDDAVYLYDYINGIGGIMDLGLVPYEIEVAKPSTISKNVSNLLIIEGHYNRNINIPFNEFTTDDWAIHEKFFNYLLDMGVHKYSNSEDITYIQKLLKEVYPESLYGPNEYFMVGDYNTFMRDKMKDYQESKINFTIGDLNKDNKLDSYDVDILRQYVDDSADYTLVSKYLADPEKNPLTPEQILQLDQDGDGIITENDKKILNDKLNQKYSPTVRSRADINNDGIVDETDYLLLKEIVENGYAYILDSLGNLIYIDLRNYDITFQLGWLDVQTEAILEYDVNIDGKISEVSK